LVADERVERPRAGQRHPAGHDRERHATQGRRGEAEEVRPGHPDERARCGALAGAEDADRSKGRLGEDGRRPSAQQRDEDEVQLPRHREEHRYAVAA